MASHDEKVDLLIDFLSEMFPGAAVPRDKASRLLVVCHNDVNEAYLRYERQEWAGLDEEYAALSGNTFDQLPFGTASAPPTPAASVHGGDDVLQSIENGQESGLTHFPDVRGSTTRPGFGPANRDMHYDENSWAMVPIVASANYVADAAPSDRKRKSGGPVILKPLPSNGYLPALITILHTIPLYRSALYCADVQLDDYAAGVEDDWWKGGKAAPSRVVDDESLDDARDRDDPHIIHEVQRLAAFLTSSNRAYGSVNALLNKDSESHADALSEFFARWRSAFEALTARSLNGKLASTVQTAGEEKVAYMFDAQVKARNGPRKDLYAVLDDNFFQSPEDISCIVEPAQVLVLRLENSDPKAEKLDCDIPYVFRVGRYLQKNKEAIAEELQGLKHHDDQLQALQSTLEKTKWRTTKKGPKVEVLKLLETSMLAFQPPEDGDENPEHAATLSKLQKVHGSIEHKLTELEQEIKASQAALDTIKKAQKPKPDSVESADTASEPDAYRLWGVSTCPNDYYVHHIDTESEVPDKMVWSHFQYITTDSDSYVFKSPVGLNEVLKRASTENRSALLVYANNIATSAHDVSIPSALQRFVQADNDRFDAELKEEERNSGWPNDPALNTIKPIGTWMDEPPLHADWETEHPSGYEPSAPADIMDESVPGADDQYSDIPIVLGNDIMSHEYQYQAHDDDESSCTLTPNSGQGSPDTVQAMGDAQMHPPGVYGVTTLGAVDATRPGDVDMSATHTEDVDMATTHTVDIDMSAAHSEAITDVDMSATHTEDIKDVEMSDAEHEHELEGVTTPPPSKGPLPPSKSL